RRPHPAMPSKKRSTPAPADAPALPYEISARVAQQARTRPFRREPGTPATRPLRIYTVDPSVSYRLGGVATVNVPYEERTPGPSGQLFDVHAPNGAHPLAAEPLDLDARALLLSSGLSPTPANGQFHMQMVYAVCSLTYAAFRRALGRDVAWACAPPEGAATAKLGVRPFGMYERNAYYDREEGGLAFGWF